MGEEGVLRKQVRPGLIGQGLQCRRTTPQHQVHVRIELGRDGGDREMV